MSSSLASRLQQISLSSSTSSSNSRPSSATPSTNPYERTYINVQPAAVASRHGGVILNPKHWTPPPASATSAKTPPAVIPQSQDVKQFIKEPSYSTILQLQNYQSAVNNASGLRPASERERANTATSSSGSGDQPIYANNYSSAISSTYSELDALFQQQQRRQRALNPAGGGADEYLQQQQPQQHYNSPPSPVSSSYSELRQATKYPPGYHLQQMMQQQQQQQQPATRGPAPNYESLYEPVAVPSGGSGAAAGDDDYFGTCTKCCEHIVGEGTGCKAMGRLYHIDCFTCHHCHRRLQGLPFYSLDGKPFCQTDYMETLEKCCKCLGPILDRILRATGKPYHPSCFTCVVCNESLDGVPFTVDATNQIHCIEHFHQRFAPKCSVCLLPIMPKAGQEETVRVVALDRSFHVDCYCCEDCGLRLSSEEEGRGCYPLDDHVLCKGCNTKRIQMLTYDIGVGEGDTGGGRPEGQGQRRGRRT